MNRVCTHCKGDKDIAEYYKNPRYRGGYKPWCKDCERKIERDRKRLNWEHERAKRLRLVYGLTTDDYNKMLIDQDHKCAICKQPETVRDSYYKNKIRHLSVDHCHKTGKVRALLCSKHNKMLGLVNDDIEVMNRMIEYIKQHSAA